MKITLLLILTLFQFAVLAQTDTTNQFDQKGKKHGLWKVYLDDKLNKVDSANYTFIGFERYDHGTKIFPFEKIKLGDNEKLEFIPYGDQSTKILSGNFKIYDSNGEMYEELVFRNGSPVLFQFYVFLEDGTKKIFESLDFSQHYKGETGSFYVENYSYNPEYIDKGWFMKGKHGWTTYSIKDSMNHSKYPYIKNYTPPLVGLMFGYEFLGKPMLEGGIYLNIGEEYGSKVGMFVGPSLSYKRNLEAAMHSVSFAFGFNAPLSISLDLNYNFGLGDRFLGFKPCIGTTLYNIQVLYGYNLFNNRKNDHLGFAHHSLTARIYIPVKKFKYYLEE